MRAALIAVALIVPPPARAAADAHPFQGESCQACHTLIRDAERPSVRAPAEDAGHHDVVVVGGGLSGLTAAYRLKDRDVLVLEKESHAGGKTYRDSFPGSWSYSVGAVYTVKPYGFYAEMFKELGIYPQRYRQTIHDFWTKDGVVEDWFNEKGIARLAKDPRDKKRLASLIALLRALDKKNALTLPMQESDPKAVALYDKETLWSFLEREYGTRAAQLGDLYAKDVFGAGGKDVSALAGLAYMEAEFIPAYGWPGGLGEIAAKLTQRLGDRVRLESRVEEVWEASGTVHVAYVRGEKRYETTADAVILALPAPVLRKIVPGLSERKRKAFEQVRYSSYAVFPMKFKRKVYDHTFILWSEDTPFSDLTFTGGDRLMGSRPTFDGQEVSAYMPLGSSDGRAKMMGATDDELKAEVLAGVEKILPGATKELEEIRVVKWGHAMPILAPGYVTKVQPILREPQGRLFFAGVDVQAPAIEGAMFAGQQAADQVRAALGGVAKTGAAKAGKK